MDPLTLFLFAVALVISFQLDVSSIIVDDESPEIVIWSPPMVPNWRSPETSPTCSQFWKLFLFATCWHPLFMHVACTSTVSLRTQPFEFACRYGAQLHRTVWSSEHSQMEGLLYIVHVISLQSMIPSKVLLSKVAMSLFSNCSCFRWTRSNPANVSTRNTIEIAELIIDGFSIQDAAELLIYPLYPNDGNDSERVFVKQLIQKYVGDKSKKQLFDLTDLES